ncbi:MAG: elongation factor G [Sphingomonadales bacterium]|nr:elongation factor G [Sphingomonadales bacterium]
MGSPAPQNPATRAASQAVRAVALVGPAGTGKTSLAEALLHASAAISRLGSVEAGTSVGDASGEARARRGSTEINVMHCESQGDRFALVDIPGGPGFAADGYAALTACDMAVVVVDAVPERAALAEPMLRRLDALGVPHVVFVNKIENARAGAVHDLVATLQPLSREPLALRQIPLRDGDKVTGYVDLALERAYRYRPGQESERIAMPGEVVAREHEERAHLLETLADFDDALLEALLTDQEPDTATVMADLAADTAGNKLVPVVLGSALNDGGVFRLLKLLRHECPGPQAAAARVGCDSGLFVFKISHGGAMGRLALGRVFGGTLVEGEELAARDGSVRSGALFALQGEKTIKLGQATAGDVIAVAKLDTVSAATVLARKGGAARAVAIDYPARNAVLAIVTRDRKDDVKLSTALHRLCEEDRALQWTQDEASHETLLHGINDEHLQVVLARLQRRYGVAVEAKAPRIAYRESIRKSASQRGRHKKQSGGHGQYGDVTIEIRPLERGEGFRFADRITGGVVPKQWIPAVELGVRDALERGPLGFPVVDVEVTLVDGSYHSVDSSELAFRIAGRMAMAEALAQAAPYLLEPVARVTVDAPAGCGSKAGSVLSSRRGHILGLAPHPEWEAWERVEALLPEAGLAGLDAELRSLSQGLASFVAAFDHLAELGGKHAEDVVKAAKQAEPA